jgi:hypothetical protein
MTEQRIRLIDELGAEFARVAADERASRSSRLRLGRATHRASPRFAIALTAIVLLSGGAYAVPVTRAAMEDIADSFAGWVDGDDSQAPGRALRPNDDAPEWVRDRGGRLIAESEGIGLYVIRTHTQERGTQLSFALGGGVEVADSIDGWRARFADHAVIVLGRAFVDPRTADAEDRVPLLGVTSRSVERVELRYDSGKPLVATGVDGGFVLMVDPRRQAREIVAYDSEGRPRME